MQPRPIHEMEAKWQKTWQEEGVYRANTLSPSSSPSGRGRASEDKFYGLVEFPYPSGDGLHVGHPRSYVAIDLVTRKRRMEGKNVLYPIGWDAFGLPTENYAIKNKIRPQDATKKNIANFTRQIKSLGVGFDWSREIDTTDPAYYKWTQWQFLQFFKYGMAYKASSTINWCPKCKIGLANEEAQGGVCERCGTAVEKREKEQWMIRITDYADRLLTDLNTVDYLEKVKSQQINWIGKSEGAEITFSLVVPGQAEGKHAVTVFTTRPDTMFGVTFLVVSPEAAKKWIDVGWQASEEVRAYITQSLARVEEERTADTKEKTGVASGVMAINPANGEQIPVWIADYVLGSYGTGAIMAVPAHDERDFAFAQKFGLPIKRVVRGPELVERSPLESSGLSAGAYGHGSLEMVHACWTGEGEAINSGFLDGAPTWKAKEDAMSWLKERGVGKTKVTYRLRDWVFSRQRYWGEPIPLVHCKACAKKKQKALLIHGFGGNGEGNWFPWMKAQLEKEGFEVFAPTLSNADHPTVEAWMEELKPFVDQLSEVDVVIGHSLGSKAALHLIERAGKSIRALFLVASAIGTLEDRNWDDLRHRWPTADIDALKRFWEEPFSWDRIGALVESKHIVISDDDHLIPLTTHREIPSGWFRRVWSGYKHFQAPEQPELLKLILTSKNTGWIPVPDDQLPLTLPEVEAYEPTDTGESPLAKMREWVETTCPRCAGPATRETDTMPNWAGSSWYFLRYCDPHNDKALASPEALKYWMPVDLYNGGMEHTTLHLLYSRFWHKFLWDVGIVPEECGSEPYRMRRSHNMILGEGGVKMSKSKGNVVNPDDVVEKYGADVFRLYEMFIGPYDQPAPWDTNGIEGMRRFLDKVWGLFGEGMNSGTRPATSDLETLYHQTVKKVSEGIENLQFNTCVSQIMILTNAFVVAGGVPDAMTEGYLQMLAPFAPHLAEEIWRTHLGKTSSIHGGTTGWPVYDATKLQASMFELVMQVNGKVRDKMVVPSDITEEEVKAHALASEQVQRWLEGKEPAQVRYIKGRLVNIVV